MTPDTPLVGLPTLIVWAVVLAAERMTLQYVAAGSTPHFNPNGLNAVVTWLALALVVAALFVQPAARATALSALVVLSITIDLVTAAVEFGAPLVPSVAALNTFWSRGATGGAVLALEVGWWIGAMTTVLRSLEPQLFVRTLGKVGALWAALFVVNALVPHTPAFVGGDFDLHGANWWEYLNTRYGARGATAIDETQQRLLQAEISALKPRQSGAASIYAVGIAGMDQDVFLKELNGALATLAADLPIKDHIVRLINSNETVATVPLATLPNLTAALHGIAAAMDKNDDVVIVVMTSHGNQTGFALQLPGNRTAELTPQQVAGALDAEGIKNRVVIVSACFSGIFMPPLANDDTIVMTAADAKSTSFGCAPERDWTYFGDALFRQSLQPGTDFQHAFAHARTLIQGWERMDRIAPSNPQGHFGPALTQKLAPFFAAQASAGQ